MNEQNLDTTEDLSPGEDADFLAEREHQVVRFVKTRHPMPK